MYGIEDTRLRAWTTATAPGRRLPLFLAGLPQMMIGYARVSTEEQNLDLQIQALKREGCDKIYTDHGISGVASARPGLARAMAQLRPGDTLIVWRLDRLGRSLQQLVKLLESLSRRRIFFHSTTEHIDMRSSGGRLVFHIMAALAEFERSLISERTRAGIAAARVNGRQVGRKPRLTEAQLHEARDALDGGTQNLRQLAYSFGVHPRTLSRGLERMSALEHIL